MGRSKGVQVFVKMEEEIDGAVQQRQRLSLLGWCCLSAM
jgi:hypothetical protein